MRFLLADSQADRLSHSVRPVVQLSGSGKRASATICQQPATLDKMMRTALSRAARLRAIHARGEERTRQNAVGLMALSSIPSHPSASTNPSLQFKRRMKESEEAKLQAEKRRRENQAIISHNDAQIAAAERMQRACRSYLDRKGNADESPWRGGGPALTSIQVPFHLLSLVINLF
jgi:ABC-type dipeptide/oligopeptide/nickel transport system ATPase component